MPKRPFYSRLTALLLAVLLAIQPLCTPPVLELFLGNNHKTAHAAPPAQGSGGSLFLPIILNNAEPGGQGGDPPDFVINSPINGSAVGGVTFFAIQPTNGAAIDRVTFRAGSTDLGADTTAGDGFRVFLNARNLPAGATELTATASGPGGETTKSINVTIVPNPPQSATIGAAGGVLASEIGSVISLLPGSVPEGTTVTVDELTQAETTTRHGIDWESMGVTFLGAQDVQASAPISRPFGMVVSAGFGNRVQPGQAVVNYRIAPDADGDGADEIVVVNTASVAPNGDVVANPVNKITVANVTIPSQAIDRMKQDVQAKISGPPGTIITLDVKGLNPNSLQGNVARFQSSINAKVLEVPVIGVPSSTDPTMQSVTLIIPPLSVGNATLTLHNESTAETSDIINLTIEPIGTLPKPTNQILDEFFVDSIQFFQTLPSSQIEETYRQKMVASLRNSQLLFAQLYPESNAAVQNFLHESAVIVYPIHNTLALYHQVGASAVHITGRQIATGIAVAAGVIGAGAAVLALSAVGGALGIGAATLATIGAAGAIIRFGAALAGAIAYGMWLLEDDGNDRQCTPTQSPSGPTGMGSAPPPGGNGCGGSGGSGGSSQMTAASLQQTSPIMVKIYVNGKPTPFTGMTDPGGYFFVPFIPAGEPFTAIAFDQATGQTRSFKGTGPQTGQSVFMFFDFFHEEPPSVRWDGGGDGISWSDAKNWDTDKAPGADDRVAINTAPDAKISLSGNNIEIISLQSSAALEINGTAVTIGGRSVISGAVALVSGASLNAKGAGVTLLLNNGLNVSNATLSSDGTGSKVDVQGQVTLYRAGLQALNGGQLLLPTAQQYNAGEGRIASSVTLKAQGAGSRIDLSAVTSLQGDISWGGRFLVQALTGGEIDLRSTAVLTTGNMLVTADGAGSQVSLSALQLLNSVPGFQSSSSLLEAKNGGSIGAPLLTKLNRVDITLGAGSNLATGQIISYTYSQATFTGLAVDMANLTTADNSNFKLLGGATVSLPGLTKLHRVGFDVNDGVTLALPNVKSYDAGENGINGVVTFKATGAGSRLDLSGVMTLLGDIGWAGSFKVQAINGGQIDLRSATVMTTGNMLVTADGSGSLVNLSGLQYISSAPGFQGPNSLLEVKNGGAIQAPTLSRLNRVDLNLNANTTLATSQIISYTNSSSTIAGVTANLNNVTTLNNVHFTLKGGGNVTLNGLTQMRRVGFEVNDGVTVALPHITTYDAGEEGINGVVTLKAIGAGSRIDLSGVTTLLGDVGWAGRFLVQATNGGQVDLRSVTALATGNMLVTADGAGSSVNLSALTAMNVTPGFQGANGLLEVKNGGTLLAQSLSNLSRSEVRLHPNSQFNCQTITFAANALLSGSGILACNVTANGQVAPGLSPGNLTLSNTYQQTDLGALTIEIGGIVAGTQYDRLTIAGAATLAGKLTIKLASNYQPSIGDTFTILNAGSSNGTFATVEGLSIGNGKKFQVQYGATTVTLQVVPQ